MGIEIPRDIADAESVPDDLDSGVVGPVQFPSPRRRRIAGFVYLGAAVIAALGGIAGLPGGVYAVAGGLALLAAYHFFTAWDVAVGETGALEIAARQVSFPVGHASAAIRFDGIRSRPTWNVILYAAGDPPTTRALVLIDAVGGGVMGKPYEETLTEPG